MPKPAREAPATSLSLRQGHTGKLMAVTYVAEHQACLAPQDMNLLEARSASGDELTINSSGDCTLVQDHHMP